MFSRVLSAGRVAKQKVNLLLGCCLIRFVTKRRGICPVLAAHDFNTESFCPNIELLDSRCAKCVCGREHYRVACVHEIARKFRRRCCFAGSIHADNQNHGRFAGRSTDWRRIAWQNARDLFAHRFNYLADSQQSPRLAFLKRFDDAHCHRHAEVSADERFFELVPINWFAGELLGQSFEKFHDVIPSEVEEYRRTTLRLFRGILRLRSAQDDSASTSDACRFTASRAGLSKSFRIRSRIPFTNRPESAPPYAFASSIASLMETTGGMSSR